MAAETIALNVNVNTGEAVSSLGQLEKATKKVGQTTKAVAKDTQTLDQQFDALNKEIKESPVNIRAMNKQIQQYQAIALEAGRTSPLGKQAIQKAAALKDRYIDIQNEVNRLANDGVKLKAVLDIGSTMVAGFAGFQGVMALAGGESEELRATMVKLQGAMSLLMAVETLRKNLEKESTIVLVAKNTAEKVSLMSTKAMTAAQTAYNFVVGVGSKAMRVFKIALAATGIGAIVLAVIALVTNFDKVTAAVKSFADMVYQFFKPSIDLVIDGLQFLGIVASDEALAQEAAAHKTIKASEDRREEIEKLQKKNEELNESVNNGLEFEIAKRKAIGKDTTELEQKLLEQRIEQAVIEQKLQLQKVQLLIKEFALKVQMGDFDKEQVEAFKENAEAELQTIKDNTTTIRDLKQGLAIFEITTEKKKNDDLKEVIESANKDKEKLAKENQLKELEILQESELEKSNLITTGLISNAEAYKIYFKNLEEQRKLDLEKEQQIKQAKVDMAMGSIDALMNINNAFAKGNEKSQKRAFEINKKLQMAQAMISTYQAAQGAFASATLNPITIGFPAYPGIMAAIAIAGGLANVATIAKQKFQSSSPGGSTPNLSSSVGGGTSAPTLSPISNTNTVLGQDNKVYVTETDISTTQNKVKVIEEQATF